MNLRCDRCKATGMIQKPGKGIGNGQPYSLVCPSCNGVGHYRERWL